MQIKHIQVKTIGNKIIISQKCEKDAWYDFYQALMWKKRINIHKY